MSLQTIAQALEATSFGTMVRESTMLYPVIMTTHLAGIGLFGGMILMTDLRLLGVAMKNTPVADVIKQTRPWKHMGATIVITCGIILAWSEALKYYRNPFFHTKITLLLLALVHGIVFRSVYKHPEEIDKAGVIPTKAKVAAALSLCIWVGVACMGRWIAYWEPK